MSKKWKYKCYDIKNYLQFAFITLAFQVIVEKYCISLFRPLSWYVKVNCLSYKKLHGGSMTCTTYLISYVLWTKLAMKTEGYSTE